MEISSPLKTDTLQPLATLVIPGTAATAPYLAALVISSAPLKRFFVDHEVTFGSLVLLVVLAAGFVLEDIGSRIEKRIWVPLQGRKDERNRVWFDYLRTAFVNEPIGERYLQSIVLRMKFELSFALSLVPMWLGLLWLNQLTPIIEHNLWCGFSITIFLLSVYLFFESYRSTVLLL